jgi:hypothetical protein
MKTFLIILTFAFTFLACSHNNAFDRFKISHERELSEESIQSSKMLKGQESGGVVSAIYLNRVYPEVYKNGEYFYIYLYLEKEGSDIEFDLNNIPATTVKELNSTNAYTKLTSFDAEWNKYYLVEFKEQGDELNLSVKNDQFSSPPLKYLKDQ